MEYESYVNKKEKEINQVAASFAFDGIIIDEEFLNTYRRKHNIPVKEKDISKEQGPVLYLKRKENYGTK